MKKTILFLYLITSLSLLFRLHAVTPFKVYPDSYQNLMVAHNIATYGGVVGYLGEKGMLYPDFFMWSRPIYPLLINLTTNISHDTTHAAQVISLLAGLLAIPLSFFFIKSVFKQTSFALAGALLTTFSFNHTVWSGFIMTETIGVFFMLLFLWSLFKNLKTIPDRFQDMYTGILFGIAILARYEYAIVVLPVILLIFRSTAKPLTRLLQILFPTGLVLALAALFLFPVQSMFFIIFKQLLDLLLTAGIIVMLFISLLFGKKIIKYVNYKIIIVLLWIFSAFLFLTVPSFQTFVIHDILISIFCLIGLTIFLQKKELHNLSYFVLLSFVFLGAIYYHINPAMDRYLTHLLPFFLIPASYGLIKILQIKTKKIFLAISLIVLLQGFITYNGIRTQEDGSWFRMSYEEKAAQKVRQSINCHSRSNVIPAQAGIQEENSVAKNRWIPDQVEDDKGKMLDDKNCLLIVSLPEPYFYNTNISTQSINDTYPYIYISDELDKETVYLIDDMGMQIYFPTFAKFIANNLQAYKQKEFFVYENFHYLDVVKPEIQPVSIYKLTLDELKKIIKNNK